MPKKNCWEFRKCGREPGGSKVTELGACPAATETRTDGINNGKNGGRTCWALCGTLCGGTVQGTYAAKIGNCRTCEFYQGVQRDIETTGLVPAEDPTRILEVVLERTVALEAEVERRVRAEEALRQAGTKLNLLASITRHDMLNKMSSIGLMMELLTEKYPEDSGARHYIRKIQTQIHSLEEMIWFTSDYQDLGVQTPTWQKVPDVIDGIRGWVQGVSLEVDPALGRYEVFADPLLSKVFYNLADNAVRHGERVTRITVTGAEAPDGLVITWEDDGIGIPDADKEKIFAKGHGKNTGLGMFLVREILSITGITIRETGVPGKGARFEMVIPEGKYQRVTGS